jgi:hypothetical protein
LNKMALDDLYIFNRFALNVQILFYSTPPPSGDRFKDVILITSILMTSFIGWFRSKGTIKYI